MIEKIEDGMELFVFKSGDPAADPVKLVQSFAYSGATQVTQVTPGTGTHEIKTVCAWYGIFYDNEIIDDHLREALFTFLQCNMFDVLCLWKKSGGQDPEYSKTPRIFRRGIELEPNSLIPKNAGSLKSTNILDGWLLSQSIQVASV